MKLLVFAHTPPPHHGQSYMVEQLLDGLGGDARSENHRPGPVACYHINARFSDDIAAIGRPQWKKVFRAVGFAAAAIGCRFRHGVRNFYFVPASGHRTALYRDWLVFALCRPFFRNLIYHWHSVGLGEWLETQARPWERVVSRWLLGRPQLSLVLAEFNRRDAAVLQSQRVAIVPNGVPDPCPDYAASVQPRRSARAAARADLSAGRALPEERRVAAGGDPEIFRVLYLGLCFSEKGLFDAVEAVVLANRRAAEQRSPLRFELRVAGKFYLEAEQRRFEERIAALDAQIGDRPAVHYEGFVSGETKARLLREADCLCFPTYYSAESFGLVVVEAMAFGLGVIATRWRAVPELFPAGYSGLVDPRQPGQIAAVLEQFAHENSGGPFRERFLAEFERARFIERLRDALLTLEADQA